MSELKARCAFDVYEDYMNSCDDEETKVYLKSEADKDLRHHKNKRRLAMAKLCGLMSPYRWYYRWLELAEKFKEAK